MSNLFSVNFPKTRILRNSKRREIKYTTKIRECQIYFAVEFKYTTENDRCQIYFAEALSESGFSGLKDLPDWEMPCTN